MSKQNKSRILNFMGIVGAKEEEEEEWEEEGEEMSWNCCLIAE